jgi:CheY-like chemotaxis protein
VGEGTTFEIYLPRVDEEPEAAEPAEVSGRGRAHPSATILLVEDEAAVRESAKRTLERLGHTVLAAGEGEEALRVAGEHAGPIDLVLTDVVMPRMGGRVLVERLRADRPGLCVLYTSGYTDEAVLRHGIVEGRVAFLQKPYPPAALAGKIAQLLTPAPHRP